MAVVDEASIKITPDTSGFASELRRELEAEIAAATAGLDDVIHIRVETEGDAARDKLRQSMNEFTKDSEDDWDRLKSDERDYFDRVGQDAEKARVKQVGENTKQRDQLKRLWQPALDRLKKEQTDEKVRLDKITASATRAAKAVGGVSGGGGGSSQQAVQAEQALAKARKDAEAATSRLDAAERQLAEERKRLEKASGDAQKAEDGLTRSRTLDEIQSDQVTAAERRLREARANGNTDAARLEQLEGDLARLREQSARGAQNTAQAEERLTEARNKASAAEEKVAAAEEKVAAAHEKVAESSRKVEEGERRASRAHDDSARSADRSSDSHRRLGDRFRDAGERGGILGGIMRGLGGVMDGVSGASRFVSNAMGKLEEALSGVVGNGKDLLQTFIQLGAQMALWITIGEAVTYVVGAIGAAVVGLPALIGAAAASFVVFKLGMDGIKRAYEAELKPALTELGKQISTVFEQGLKPVFHELATKLIPAVTDNLKGLAGAFVGVASEVQHVITSSEGLNNIKGIIDKTTNAVLDLGPPLAGLVDGFLRLANTGTILQNMVGIIGDLLTNVTNFFNEMQRTNDAERAVQALRGALDATEKAILQVLHSATNFFTQATPGFERLVTSVGNIVSALINRLGPAFNTTEQAAATFLDKIPPSSLDAIRDAVQHVADAFQRFADSGAPKIIADGVAELTQAFADAVDIVSSVVDAYNRVRTAIAQVDDALGIATSAEEDMLRASGQAAGGANSLADSLAGIPPPAAAIPPPVDAATGSLNNLGQTAGGLPGQVQPPMDATRTAIEDSMRRAQEAARTGGQGVHDGVTGPLPSMQQTTQVSFDTLPPVVRDAMVGAEAAARTGSDLVKTAVTDGFNNAAQAATDAMNRLRDAVQTGFTAISTAVQGAMTGVSTQIIGTFQNIASVVQTSVQQIVQSAQRMAQGIQQAAQQMSTAMGNASSQVQGFLTAISSAFQSNMQLSQQAVTTGMTAIQTAIQNGTRDSVTAVQNGMRDMLTAIRDGMRDAVRAAQDGMRDILQAFTSQEGAMEAAGQALIDRLTAGMIAAGARATAAAASIAASIRAQFPSSPAKEGPLSGSGDPLRSGGVIMQRLADGISNNASAVAAALQPILNAAMATISAVQAAASASAAMASSGGSGLGQAARLILDRMNSGQPIFEDWTWRGAPSIVGQYNDQLEDMFGSTDVFGGSARAFLAKVASGGDAAQRQQAAAQQQLSQAQAMVSALSGVKLQFVPGTQGAMAQFVNQGNTQLVRR